ncbi:MAG: HEAT repeat domain-containing protein [Chloroflexota bacterium]|nr:HEAT repeat domain-containing protein [Chloroflexota bacterium]
MAQVFVSYSRSNKAFVDELRAQHARLKTELNLDFDLWIDEHRIKVGTGWTAEIDRNIRESFAIVLVISKASLESRYVNYEWAFGLGAEKVLLPVLLEPTILPLMLQNLNYLDFTDNRRDWVTLLQGLYDAQNEIGDLDELAMLRVAIDRLRTALSDLERRDAIETLGQMKHQPKAIDALVTTIRRTILSQEIRVLAAEKLLLMNTPDSLKPLSNPELALLLAIMMQPRYDRDVRSRAADLLLHIGSDDALMAITRSPNLEPYNSLALDKLIDRKEKALPVLLRMVDHDDYNLRRAAVIAFRHFPSPSRQIIKKLVARLSDPEPRIQREAATTLLALESPEAWVAALYSYDSDSVALAAQKLSKAGDTALPLLAEALGKSSGRILQTIIEVMIQMGYSAAGRLMHALENERPEVRQAAARALGEIGYAKAVHVLNAYVTDPVKNVRASVVDALGQIGHVDSIDTLNTALYDSDIQVRLAAVRAMGKIRTSKAVEHLFAPLHNAPVDVRMSVIEQLAELRDPEAVAPLIDVIESDPVYEVRAAAESALLMFDTMEAYSTVIHSRQETIRSTAEHKLLEIDTVESLAVVADEGSLSGRIQAVERMSKHGLVALHGLIAALDDENPTVRRNAVLVIGTLETTRAIPDLVAQLNDEATAVREAVVRALGRIGVSSIIEPMLNTLGDNDKNVRDAAVEVLSGMNHAVGPKLIAILKQSDNPWWMRHAAIRVLGNIRYAGALTSLIAALKDEKGEVREESAKALGAICDSSAVKPLQERLNDPDDAVRVEVKQALKRIGTPEAKLALQRNGGT